MSCVHYKFSSKLNYDTVTFDGLHISLCDLKKQIMGREKLKAADCDLQITNAQTKEGRSPRAPRSSVRGAFTRDLALRRVRVVGSGFELPGQLGARK